MISALEKDGFDYIIIDENLTRYGAVETIAPIMLKAAKELHMDMQISNDLGTESYIF